MKNYKESGKKSYHELMEEMDDKKGFSRSDLPRKRKEITKSDDEPMVSMAKSESYQRRSYDDQDRKPYPPRNPGEYKKPYTPREGGEFKKPYTPREGGEFKKPYTPREGAEFKKPYTPREGGEFKKPYTPREGAERKPYPPREGQGFKKPYDPNRSSEYKKPFDQNKPYTKPFKKTSGDR